MVRSNSEIETSIKSIEAMYRRQGVGNATVDGDQAATGEAPADPPSKHPQANERARSTLFIELPTAHRARSRLASDSLKESYLSLHLEFISGKRFIGQIANRIQNGDENNALLTGSFADGPIPLVEILLTRLTFSLEGTGGNGNPVLVLESLAETTQAAKQLANLAQSEYLRFVKNNEEKHPKLLRLETKLREAQKERWALENDLAAYRRLNEKPVGKDQDAELLAQLSSCRAEKSKLAGHLREITQAFAANPNDIENLANLKSLAEFETIGLMLEKRKQLEKLINKYQAEGNLRHAEKIKKLEATTQNLRTQVPREINRAIAGLKDRLQSVLNEEVSLAERLVGAQQDWAQIALNFPKATKLQVARYVVIDLEEQLKGFASRWHQARKHIIMNDLSKSIPRRQLQPLVP